MTYVTGVPVDRCVYGGAAPSNDPPAPISADASPAQRLPPFDVTDYRVRGVTLPDMAKLTASPAWPWDASAAPLFPALDASSDWALTLDPPDAPRSLAWPVASSGDHSSHPSSPSAASSQSSHTGSTATGSGSSPGLPSTNPSPQSSTGVPCPGHHSLMMLPPSPFTAADPLTATDSPDFPTLHISAHSRAAAALSAQMSQRHTAAGTASTQPVYPCFVKHMQNDKRRPNSDVTPALQHPRAFGASIVTQPVPSACEGTSFDNPATRIPSEIYSHLGSAEGNPPAAFYHHNAYPHQAPLPSDFANVLPNQRYRMFQPPSAVSDPMSNTFTSVFTSQDTQISKDENTGHNAVEKRYRNNINNNIAALADLVPALSHLRALPSAATSRRHSSQFIVSASAIGKIPSGLVDGVRAAQKLSKGSILSKSVDYIRHLRRTRDEMNEDAEELKIMVKTLVDGGHMIVEQWEERVKSKAPAREKSRFAEQAGGEDGEDDDDEGGGATKPPPSKKRKGSDPKPAVGQVAPNHKRPGKGVRQPAPSASQMQHAVPQHAMSHGGGATGDLIQGLDFDPTQFASLQNMPPIGGYVTTSATGHSPGSGSSYGGTPPYVASHAPQADQRRQMLAIFMGVTFAAGTGIEYRLRHSWASEMNTARTTPHFPNPSDHAKVYRPVLGSVQVGFQVLGFVSMVLLGILLVRPNWLLYQDRCNDHVKTSPWMRHRRQHSKAFEQLAQVPTAQEDDERVYDAREFFSKQDSLESAVVARQKLMHLAGGPEGALQESISLAREATLAMYRKAKAALHLGGSDLLNGGDASSIEATENALTWVRIAEIETALGPLQTSAVSRLHTALRLYNLSRSAEWPKGASSPAQTSFPRVNAVLSLHLRTLLGDTNSVSEMLWQQAMNRKDTSEGSAEEETWVGEALSANFDEACRILGKEVEVADGMSAPSDTLPLLKIAEVRSEAALLELWSRIWVQTVKRTCPVPDDIPRDIRLGTLEDLATRTEEISAGLALQVAAARAVMEEAVNHIFSSTMPSSTIRTLACVTKGVWALAFGNPEVAYTSANVLARESTQGGPASRLACVAAFLGLMFSKKKADVILGPGQMRTPRTTVDKVATATISWLYLRRRHFVLQMLCERDGEKALSSMTRGDGNGEGDEMRRLGIRLKHLLMDAVFTSDDVIRTSTKQTREAIEAGEAKEYDLGDAVKDCLAGLEKIMKRVEVVTQGRLAVADKLEHYEEGAEDDIGQSDETSLGEMAESE